MVYDLAALHKKVKVIGDKSGSKSGDPQSFLDALKKELDLIRKYNFDIKQTG